MGVMSHTLLQMLQNSNYETFFNEMLVFASAGPPFLHYDCQLVGCVFDVAV